MPALDEAQTIALMIANPLLTLTQPLEREHYYRKLMDIANGSVNSRWLAQMIASWQAGEGVLPNALGLSESEFEALLTMHFAGFRLSPIAPSGKSLDLSGKIFIRGGVIQTLMWLHGSVEINKTDQLKTTV